LLNSGKRKDVRARYTPKVFCSYSFTNVIGTTAESRTVYTAAYSRCETETTKLQ